MAEIDYDKNRSELHKSLYNKLGTDKTPQAKKVWDSKGYSNYNTWYGNYFKDYNSAVELAGKVSQLQIESIGTQGFIKKYACDIEWAKSYEYCKVSGQYEAMSPENKEKFKKKYPCVSTLIDTSSAVYQKIENGNTILTARIDYKDIPTWIFMTTSMDPEATNKYDNLAINDNTKEKGKFKCKTTSKSTTPQPSNDNKQVIPPNVG